MADGVKMFLSSVGMERHFSMFQTRGYDDEANIPHLTVSDLQNIGVIDPMEIIIILKAGELLIRPDLSFSVWKGEEKKEGGGVFSVLTYL